MDSVVAIGVGAIYLLTVVAFLYLIYKLENQHAQKEDLLLERIQRPEYRPTPLATEVNEPLPDPFTYTDTELSELAAVGSVNPDVVAIDRVETE